MEIHSLDIEINKLQDQLRDKQQKKKSLNLELKGLRLNTTKKSKGKKGKKEIEDDSSSEDIDIVVEKKDETKHQKVYKTNN